MEQVPCPAHPGRVLTPPSGGSEPPSGEVPDGAIVASPEATIEAVAVIARVTTFLDVAEEVQGGAV